MKSLNIEEKIKKSVKFIRKKFHNALIEVKVVDEGSRYIQINDDDYNIINNLDKKCNGILILQNGENNFYQFKEILKKVPEYFNGNGLVFIRYDNSLCDSTDYIENQFTTYLKLNKFKDIEQYVLLSESGKESGLFITASYHMELLEKENEYEVYTQNIMIPEKKSGGCGGCSGKGCGNSERACGCSGNCSSCNKGCH